MVYKRSVVEMKLVVEGKEHVEGRIGPDVVCTVSAEVCTASVEVCTTTVGGRKESVAVCLKPVDACMKPVEYSQQGPLLERGSSMEGGMVATKQSQ